MSSGNSAWVESIFKQTRHQITTPTFPLCLIFKYSNCRALLWVERETWFSNNSLLTGMLTQNCKLYLRLFLFQGGLKLWAWPGSYEVSQVWLKVMSKEWDLKYQTRLSLLKIKELVFWFQISWLALLFVQDTKCIEFSNNKFLNPVLKLME